MTVERDGGLERARHAAARLLGLNGPASEAEIAALAAEMQWLSLQRGELVCQQGDPSDALFVLVSGRALAVHYDAARGTTRIVNEIRPSETIGEMGLLSGEPRSVSVVCSRDSELLRFERTSFDRLLEDHPRALFGMSRTLVDRLRHGTLEGRPARRQTLLTLAVLPAASTDAQLLRAVATSLASALREHGPTGHVSSADVPPDLRITEWLNDLEQAHRFLVLEAESGATPWTERCIRQADRLLQVARAEASGQPGPVEEQVARLCAGPAAPSLELVLVQSRRDVLPVGTARWLSARGKTMSRHHHIHLGTPATFARLARWLAGRAVALALGGGGARGFAHIGVIRALREMHVPIDLVVGTSMGAIVGAQCALEWTTAEMLRRNHAAFIARNPLADYTLPLVAAHSGRGAARMLRELFGDVQIEDLWTAYADISSNLTRGTVAAHSSGSLRKNVRASISVPGILPPVAESGDLLVDGGVLNNLPADVARELVGNGPVIAVDVNPRTGLRVSEDYGEVLDGWSVATRRANPFGRRWRMPTIYDLLERMTMFGSIQQAAQSVQAAADLYLHPPTDMVRFLDFRTMEAHAQRGYEFALPLVARWVEQGAADMGAAGWSIGSPES
jgi:predicted acylesterase/phospholipase RssA/CRP-like cAMP-binding protein